MNIGGMIQTWIDVLTHPGEEIFETEGAKDQAKLSTAVIWIIISTVIVALLGFLRRQLVFGGTDFGALLEQANLPPEATEQLSAMFESGLLSGLANGAGLASVVITPIVFLIFVGIYHLIARVLGGQGEYGKYAFLIASFQAPIAVLVSVLSFVPWIGSCFGAFISIYGLVLAFFATKVNYQFSAGKAFAVLVIPIVIGMVLVGCGFFATIGALIASSS